MPTTGPGGRCLYYTCNTLSKSISHRPFSIWASQQRRILRSSRECRRSTLRPDFSFPRSPQRLGLEQDGDQSSQPSLVRPSSIEYMRRKRLGHMPLPKQLGQDKYLIPMIRAKLDEYIGQSRKAKFLASIGLEGKPIKEARERCTEFIKQAQEKLKGWGTHTQLWTPPSMLEPLRQAAIRNGEEGLSVQLLLHLQGFIANYEFTMSDVKNQAKVADLRYPSEWFPATRAVQRTIHLHVGPTNSGKTYHALKRLEQAETGIYAGPLRLLAHEVYSRLNASGKLCSLVTGDEQIMAKTETGKPTMISCTVEMVPLNADVEVAVVDEIQLLGNRERGWAWTQAVLGLKARELHLCGEERALPIVQELAAATGDTLVIHRYERLSPLKCMVESLDGDLQKLRKGDCVVVFSRPTLHKLKITIEQTTGKRVAVIYGSLPPEIRAQQARLFNDPDNDYDFLVATDAVGMGLNLGIKRIVFESIYRNKGRGQGKVLLPVQDIKQISGRAGRYRTARDNENETKKMQGSQHVTDSSTELPSTSSVPQNLGLVTTLEPSHHQFVKIAMESEAEPILSAGILPPASILQRFATYFPSQTPFSYILVRLHEISRMHPRFHLCDVTDQIGIADLIQSIKSLTVMDRIQFCSAPVSLRDPSVKEACFTYAECVGNQGGGELLQIQALNLDLLDVEIGKIKRGLDFRTHMADLESLHKSLVLYLWLSYRFSGVFTSQMLAFHVKRLTEEKIDEALDGFWAQRLLKHREEGQQIKLQEFRQDILSGEFQLQSGDSNISIPVDQGTLQHSMPLLDDAFTSARPIATAA